MDEKQLNKVKQICALFESEVIKVNGAKILFCDIYSPEAFGLDNDDEVINFGLEEGKFTQWDLTFKNLADSEIKDNSLFVKDLDGNELQIEFFSLKKIEIKS